MTILFNTFFGLALLGLAGSLLFYLLIYLRAAKRAKRTLSKYHPPVSVVICARNEADNLKAHLPAFLNQDYSDYEVVVVNDCSEDHTDDVLQGLQKEYSHLRYTYTPHDPAFPHGKKLAMSIGIKAAKNDILLFSDADCRPVSAQWIQHMTACFDEKTQIVLGYGGYAKRKSLLNALIRWDSFFIAMQFMGFAKAGIPYMGVGRNMAYRKSFWREKKGFAGFSHLVSGDDDLFVNRHATKSNIAVCNHPQAATSSEPPMKMGEWMRQKARHHSTGRYYKSLHKFLLVAEPVTRVLLYAGIVLTALFASSWEEWLVPASILLVKWIVQLCIVAKTMKYFGERHLLLYSIIFDILIPFIYVIFALKGMFFSSKTTAWK